MFKPQQGITQAECDALFDLYKIDYDSWLDNCKDRLAGGDMIITTVYYTACCVMVTIGVGLIYKFTQRIVAYYKEQVRLNWLHFVAHVIIMYFLVVS